MSIRAHLAGVPADLAKALDDTYRSMLDHFLKEEPDDAEVDAGRFCEAALRYVQWKMTGTYTPIDGKSKPNRKQVVQAARQDTRLPPTLRAQVPQAIELVMDFRNNRNSAHLGSIDPNTMDAGCVVQNVSWVIGEIARLESNKPTADIQTMLDRLADRHFPVIQNVDGTPIVLDTSMTAAQKALVLLHQHAAPVPMQTLREWAEYSNSTQWRRDVIGRLKKAKKVHVDAAGNVHLLRPGEVAAEELLLAAAAA